MNIVILDGHTANPGDLSWDPISRNGHFTAYDKTTPDQVISRSQHADILVVNKVAVTTAIIKQLPRLKCICLLATGYDNVDVEAAQKCNITVCNAVGYGADSVAQHVFALILYWTNQVAQHDSSVRNGQWYQNSWSYSLNALHELKGKTLGIAGYGKIGRRVSDIGKAFGMQIAILESMKGTHDSDPGERLAWVPFLNTSDFVSLHLPLTDSTKGIIHTESLGHMKKSAFLINTGRGGLIVEEDLAKALEKGTIAGASLDVISQEPPVYPHPLIGLKNCILTPHNAWATAEARERLIKIVGQNIRAFKEGKPINTVRA
jgi:glycerate dehydrogenase